MLDQQNKQVLQDIIDASPVGMFITDHHGKVTWFNGLLNQLLGEPQSSFIGQTLDTIKEELKPLFAEQGIVQIEHDTGTNIHLICSRKSLEQNDAILTIHYVRDTSNMHALFQERNELKNIIEEMKAVDPLTNMPNYRAIISALEPQVSRSRRYGNVLSLIIVQLTNLHAIQKKIGEEQTSDLIIACSHMLNDQVRWADMIGHIDDHEFLLILPETSKKDGHKLNKILNKRFSAIQTGDMQSKKITLSTNFGIAEWHKGLDVPLFIQEARDMLKKQTPENAVA
ncbi:diguanylate cyclase [Beggiatoa alba]|nr:diguanylate cyclase [Beggiatoa alba]